MINQEKDRFPEAQKTIDEMRFHIRLVQKYLSHLIDKLTTRGVHHDESKWDEEYEFPLFLNYTPKLKTCSYGSPEYKQYLKELKPALDHHYQLNRHHPEHHKGDPGGIAGMNLVDLMEMLCDWLAATERHPDGNILKSIEINQKRFGYSDDVKSILERTAAILIPYIERNNNESTA